MSKGVEYTCAACGKTFLTGWSDEEAIAERDKLWGADGGPFDVVCDDCFDAMTAAYPPEEYRADTMEGE